MRRLIALAVAAIALSACAGGSPGASDASAVPSSSATPAGSATSAGPNRLVVGFLDPGVYTTSKFQPPLQLTLGEGWRAYFADDDDELAVEHTSGTFLAMTRVTEVVDPTSGTAVPAPEDLVQWFAAHPRFEADEPGPIEIGGMPGKAVIVTAPEEIEFFAYPTGNMRAPAGTTVRVAVLPMDGPDLAIVVSAPTAGFEDGLELVGPILDSLEIKPTGG